MTPATASEPGPRILSPDTLRGDSKARTPPGQALTAKWPVLHYGAVPKVDPEEPNWWLKVFGLVEEPYELAYPELRAMPAVDVVCDIHCVTHWSRLDNVFAGVPTKAIIDRARPRPNARFVMCHSEAGFTVNVPLSDFIAQDCILAYQWAGSDITGPAPVPLEECQVDPRHRTPRHRRPRLLGTERLPHARRPVEGRAIRMVGSTPASPLRWPAVHLRTRRLALDNLCLSVEHLVPPPSHFLPGLNFLR